MNEYQQDYFAYQKQYKYFNDRNFHGYMKLAQEDTFKYVPPPKDPNDWRNFIRTGDERNKLDGLLSFLFDLNFRAEPIGRDWTGKVREEVGEFGTGFLRYLNILDDTDVKDPLTDLAMFSVGTVFKQIRFVTKEGTRKIAGQWNPGDPIEKYKYSTSTVTEFEGIESTLWKPNRVLLADITQPDIEKQDHIWYETVIPYASAYQTFCSWDGWQYVKPYSPQYDQWTDSDLDIETEDDQKNDKVRIRFRESIVTNELSIYCNKVLMTPPGLELPDGEYSMIMQQAGFLDPHFAYGRSFMDNVRGWVAVKDVLMSTGVDISRQILEPPLKSRFRTMVNKYMLAPRSVTPMQGDGDLTPILPESAGRDFVMQMMQQIDGAIEKASISPVFQGQSGSKGGQMTKFEVQQQLTQSIRNIASMVGAAAMWRKKESEKKLRLGLKHLEKIVGKGFDVVGEGGDMQSIEFGSQEGLTKPKHLDIVRTLKNAENIAKSKGINLRKLSVDKNKAADATFVIDFRVNPQSRDSDASDQKDMIDKVNLLRSGPTIDQKAVDKMLVKALGESTEDFIQKQQQPGMQPGQPPMGSQPGQPPQQGQQVPQQGDQAQLPEPMMQ